MRFLVLCLLVALPLWAHVGSPDVFYEGKAGSYSAIVTIRPPVVIPGVAEVEIRFPDDDIREVRIVPLPLTGLGADRPPTPDLAVRSKEDPRYFTGSIWLMGFGSYQVRIDADGAKGPGRLSVPIPALALQVKKMDRPLGVALFAVMFLLVAGIVAIVGAAVKEAKLKPGSAPPPENRRAARITMGATAVGLAAIVILGFRWWNSDESVYLSHVYKPLIMNPKVAGSKLSLEITDPGWFRFRKPDDFIPDHGHLMHLFLIRMPDMDRMWHLHPDSQPDGSFGLDLPSMPAGQYKLFADVVHENGFPETLVAAISVPAISGRALSGDDAEGSAPPISTAERTVSPMRDSYRMVWMRGSGAALPLAPRKLTQFTFRIEDEKGNPATDMQLYMGMPGHAEFVNSDASVFAHVHPDGSVPMASLMLTKVPMQHATGAIPSTISFPYGFPAPGHYRIFVQVQRAGHPETGVFDVIVPAGVG
jgi:hypothetical protein